MMAKRKWYPNERKALKKWKEFLSGGMSADVANEIIAVHLERFGSTLDSKERGRIAKAIMPEYKKGFDEAIQEIRYVRRGLLELENTMSKAV